MSDDAPIYFTVGESPKAPAARQAQPAGVSPAMAGASYTRSDTQQLPKMNIPKGDLLNTKIAYTSGVSPSPFDSDAMARRAARAIPTGSKRYREFLANNEKNK